MRLLQLACVLELALAHVPMETTLPIKTLESTADAVRELTGKEARGPSLITHVVNPAARPVPREVVDGLIGGMAMEEIIQRIGPPSRVLKTIDFAVAWEIDDDSRLVANLHWWADTVQIIPSSLEVHRYCKPGRWGFLPALGRASPLTELVDEELAHSSDAAGRGDRGIEENRSWVLAVGRS